MDEIVTDKDGEWCERRDRPSEGDIVYCYSEADDALHRAEVWLWQTGNTWIACPAYEVETWWDGDPSDFGAPTNWCRPISDIPEIACFWFSVNR